MSLLIVCPGRDPGTWIRELKREDSSVEIERFDEDHKKEEVEFILSWNHPRGIFQDYPNLKVIASMGAGVDHIISDPDIPENIKITKVIDDSLEGDMSNFVLMQCLNYLRNTYRFYRNQQKHTWDKRMYRRPENTIVGILGMGILGQVVGEKLFNNGFKVQGWSASEKDLENIKTYAGDSNLNQFLKNSAILICLLPLTSETENFLNREVFQKLPKGAYLINVARGGHLNEDDLIEFLDNEHLAGAALDVFKTEPLPEDHVFWEHSKIHITSHVASITHPESIVPQILENYQRMKTGKKLKHTIDRDKGY
ncbi:glyoxylate/hydroxypyruvate reductase A [Gramella sp. AN32]|uniref:2-hydroxyacid dehydrogenase n=1 Tax=Christiangramia antarctica TaxID=2058158 RepID=A0ABW5X2V3_9FLAO|nr:glyoxylate/hydroxypyruvate reductase A [Gramella sp. AN32]MCM4157765.1 glyoxylate/hydroxypyruvate reductase A [Gramella sp. AN32]